MPVKNGAPAGAPKSQVGSMHDRRGEEFRTRTHRSWRKSALRSFTAATPAFLDGRRSVGAGVCVMRNDRLPTNIVAKPDPMMALKQYATMFREALPVAGLFVFKE
jgi:hypothetical protein